MRRAVFDTNVLASALVSPRGTPAKLVLAWSVGSFELIVSPALVNELSRVLAYPKLRRRVREQEAASFVAWLLRSAEVVPDPPGGPPIASPDPDDAYLLTLAAAQSAVLVTGDRQLLALEHAIRIQSPADFLAELD